jgi:uncharacterized protein YecE (DUF72 family)
MSRIVVGTSSWTDPGFIADWYPPDLPARDRLAYYAERFDAVEVNATHYAVPSERTVRRWAEATPDAFTFDVKLHKLLSRHRAEPKDLPTALRDRAETDARGRVILKPRLEAAVLDATLEALAPLDEAGKLSTLLLQLSPSFKPRDHELGELAKLVERAGRAGLVIAIELRHKGWLDAERRERTLAWFEDHGAAFVCVDAPEGRSPTIMPNLDAVTNEHVAYLRAHGRNAEGYMRGRTVAERFDYVYDDDELHELGERAGHLAEEAAEVRVMFNNNRSDYAPRAAERFQELVPA